MKLWEANRDLRLERAATGEVIIMPPTTLWTGRQNGIVVLNAPTRISGEDVLPGFVLDLTSIW
ncbi:MAG: hypothetical protein AB1589_34815 [Cyanobacteriota bacterium]